MKCKKIYNARAQPMSVFSLNLLFGGVPVTIVVVSLKFSTKI